MVCGLRFTILSYTRSVYERKSFFDQTGEKGKVLWRQQSEIGAGRRGNRPNLSREALAGRLAGLGVKVAAQSIWRWETKDMAHGIRPPRLAT